MTGIPSEHQARHQAELERTMSFCDHCEGQRFDRARVLRALRLLRKDVGKGRRKGDEVLDLALKAIKALDIPHLELVDEGTEMVH